MSSRPDTPNAVPPSSVLGHDQCAPTAIYDRDGWRTYAACRDLAQAVFFPAHSTKASTRRAKAVCATCPVQGACLQFALRTNQGFGVWGGHDEKERFALQSRRSRRVKGSG